MNFASMSAHARALAVAAWLIAALAALPIANMADQALDATARLGGSDSAELSRVLRERFRSPFAELALLRVTAVPSPLTPAGRSFLVQVTQSLYGTPAVAGVLSYLDADDPTLIGADGSPVVIVGLRAHPGAADALMRELRSATDALRRTLRNQYPQVAFHWTGEAVVNADIRRVGSEQTRRAEIRVFPITLVLLLIAFRSVVAALLPLLCGALTMQLALALSVAVNHFWPMSAILMSVVSMVGLGLSIDYALLIISRYREALGRGLTRQAAAIEAGARGGRTVIVSGSAVAIGFSAMLLVGVDEVRSIGVGGLIVTTVAVLVATTLLPPLLVWLGSRIDAGRIGRKQQAQEGRYWRGWAAWVGGRPLLVLVVAALPLVLLAAQAARLKMDLPRGDWLPANVESVRVLHELEAIGRANLSQTIRIVVTLPAGATVWDPAGWGAVSKLSTVLAADPRIDHVWSVTTLPGAEWGGPAIGTRLAEQARRSLVSADDSSALVEVLPREGTVPADVTRLVREIRAKDAQVLTGLRGTYLLVGGVPAFNADYEDAISSSLLKVAASVVCAMLIALTVAFRSLLIPLKAVMLNILSVAAAFGAVVLVFQDGYGSRLLGLAQPLNGGFPILPILVFCAVFGLSMDYEVFLVARVADGHRAGLADGAALAEGLARTGRVITLAAAVMVAIFASFMLGDFVLIKILGFALSVAVLLDATLVRLALGPALIRLAGRFNWWPGGEDGGP